MPLRLPAISKTLSTALSRLAPTELDVRRTTETQAAAEVEPIPCGFQPWQEIVASMDLCVGPKIVAPLGSTGIVLENSSRVAGRIMVSFDNSETKFFDVMPQEIMLQLPPSFECLIAQRVFARRNLMVGTTVGVSFGTQGTVLRRCPSDETRLVVEFDGGLGTFNVTPDEVRPYCKLVGGFFPAQRVKAAKNLVSGDTLLVKSGISGVVQEEFSDTRITVRFEYREDGLAQALNVSVDAVPLPISAILSKVACASNTIVV